MRCAVVKLDTGVVVNVIMANAETDRAPEGAKLVSIPEDQAVDMRWVWNETDGLIPGPELQAELDAQAAAVEAEAYSEGDLNGQIP